MALHLVYMNGNSENSKWMNIEDLMLSEVNQTLKDTHCIYPFYMHQMSGGHGRNGKIQRYDSRGDRNQRL